MMRPKLNHTTFVHRCVPSLAKSPLPPFVKGGAQCTGDLSPQIMCTNLAWSDLVYINMGYAVGMFLNTMKSP